MMKTTVKWVMAGLAAVTVGILSACTGTTTQNTASSVLSAISAVSSTASDTDVTESTEPIGSVAESRTEQSTAPAESSTVQSTAPAESSITSDTAVEESRQSAVTSAIEGNHPSYLVGHWALKLDTSGLEDDAQSEASERMANTSMILYANGTAVGITYDSRIDGEWGEANGYVYVTLGTATEYFRYYVDTLESMNYAGMSFIR